MDKQLKHYKGITYDDLYCWFRTISGSDGYAMTGNGDNDTSVQSNAERDKTVAAKEGGLGRSSGW